MARNKRNMGLIRRFVPYFKKYKWVLVLDLFCASLTTVCELVLPLIVQYITDMGMNNLEALTVQIILQLGLFYLVLRVIDGAANYYMASIGHIMGARIETDMRRDLFDRAHVDDVPVAPDVIVVTRPREAARLVVALQLLGRIVQGLARGGAVDDNQIDFSHTVSFLFVFSLFSLETKVRNSSGRQLAAVGERGHRSGKSRSAGGIRSNN